MAALSSCPSCKQQVRVPEDLIGKAVRCPTCGATFTADAGAFHPIGQPDSSQESERLGQAPFNEGKPAPREYDPGRPPPIIRRDTEPHRGVLILLLGILSIVLNAGICGLGLPLGIPAWIMGNTDMPKIRSGQMDREGEGLTNAGRICGIIGTILGLLGCALASVVVVFWLIGA